jgi:hypothetical protein
MRKRLITSFLFYLLIVLHCASQQPGNTTRGMAASVWDSYDRYQEQAITNRFFKNSDIVKLIQKHGASGVFKHTVAGNSTQGRPVYHLTMGRGKTKVFLWSQMHGDESTATMALFDLFNFFAAKDANDPLREYLLSNLELHFVPMLNPDGAEVWQRRNALDIDINRDARLLATPEGKILATLAKELKPAFGFNLHDQSVYYTAGSTHEPATISFLAPAYNYEKDMNDVRTKATQLIVLLNRALQQKAPGKVARYDDEHDPRCFGDTFQGWGMSTILIESGGYPNDIEKQYIRKLNFHALLVAFEAIASKGYASEPVDAYQAIPENSRFLYDLVVRNVRMERDGQTYTGHLGIIRWQIKKADNRSVYFRGSIEEVGDMDRQFGYDELDAGMLHFMPGKVKVMTKKEWQTLSNEQALALIKEGFLFVKWSDERPAAGAVYGALLNLTGNENVATQVAAPGQNANFLLARNNVPVYAVINGFLLDLSKPPGAVANTMGY